MPVTATHDGEDGGRQDGPGVLRVEEVVEAGDEVGDGPEGEVQDARGRVGDDQAGGADRVDPSRAPARRSRIGAFLQSPPHRPAVRRGVSNIDVDSDTNDARRQPAQCMKELLTWSDGSTKRAVAAAGRPPVLADAGTARGARVRRRGRPRPPRSRPAAGTRTRRAAPPSPAPPCRRRRSPGRRAPGTMRRRPQSSADAERDRRRVSSCAASTQTRIMAASPDCAEL